MVPPSSVKITRVPTYLICLNCHFVYGAITLYGVLFQTLPLQQLRSASPLSLAATQGISVDFFSSGYLDISVPRVRLVHLCIQCTIPLRVGFPIRTSPDQCLLPTPRRFSQAATSFIASDRQGIRRMRLVA